MESPPQPPASLAFTELIPFPRCFKHNICIFPPTDYLFSLCCRLEYSYLRPLSLKCLSLFLEIGKDLIRFYLEGAVKAGEKLVLNQRLDCYSDPN